MENEFPHFQQPSSSNDRPNRFVFVKKTIIDTFKANSSTKVLINPNFKPRVHLNPNFKTPLTKVKHSVYVNPNMLKKDAHSLTQPVQNKRNSIILNTRTKFVRSSSGTGSPKGQVKKTYTPIKSRYKLVRSTSSAINSELKSKLHVKKLYYIKNKFKIDKRPQAKRKQIHSVYRSTPKCAKTLNMTLKTRNVIIKSGCKTNKSHYVSINGILYKRSPNTLKKANLKKFGNESIIRIRGSRYKLDSKQRTLRLLPSENSKSNMKQIHIGGVKFKRNSKNEFVKINASKSSLLSQAKYKSIRTLTNKMKKSNLPCPFYRKFGRCKGQEKGTCIRIHNPDQISLCSKFLQGACHDEKCLLSHKVSAKKMPTCKFYLEGLCFRDNCPYLHVKINKKADICEDFLEGFCNKAEKCDKRHEFLCPRFEKSGICSQKKCPYPHGKAVRKNRCRNQVATKSADNEKCCDKAAADSLTKQLEDKDLQENQLPTKNIRYYKDIEQNPSNQNKSDDAKNDDSNYITRPKLGDLPYFIPLLNQSLT